MTIYKYPGTEQTETTVDLTDLQDVTISDPVADEVLTFDPVSKQWVNRPVVVEIQTADLGDLGDVTLTSPANDEVLTFDFASNAWVNKPAPASGATAFDDLTDVNLAGLNVNDIVVWNGASWVPQINSTVNRATFNPAAIVLGQDTIFDTYNLTGDTAFVLGTNTLDYAEAVLPLNSDGVSTITWDANMRTMADHAASLPPILPVGVNTLRMVWDATLGFMLVDVTTQKFTADGAQPMTGDFDAGGNDLVNVSRVTPAYIKKPALTGPASGSFTPDFSVRSNFNHGVLTGALTINNPTNQEAEQEGVIKFDNTSAHGVTLGTNFVIMDGQDPTIPSGRVVLTYHVFSPGVVLYSVRSA